MIDRRSVLLGAAAAVAGVAAGPLDELPAAAAGPRLRVMTWNAPRRLDPSGRARARFLAGVLDAYAVDVVAGQEWTDRDPRRVFPRSWGVHRPSPARSTMVAWRRSSVDVTRRGWRRLDGPGDGVPTRGVSWVAGRVRGHRAVVGSVHLPAFKTSSRVRAAAFREQEPAAAAWLSRGPRILAGDLNATVGTSWTRNLDRVGEWSRPVPSGPRGLTIDYVGAHRCGPWVPVRTWLVRGSPSDHDPVVVELRKV